MNYDTGQPFIEVTFPTKSVNVALFRREDILRVIERDKEGKPVVTLFVRNLPNSGKDNFSEWHFDGNMEEFKKATKTVYL